MRGKGHLCPPTCCVVLCACARSGLVPGDLVLCAYAHVVLCACARSGLVPGDLDPTTTTHYLTTMKHAYLKLRCVGV